MGQEKLEQEKELFLQTVRELVAHCESSQRATTKEKLNDLAFHILSLLDGELGDSKGYKVIPLSESNNDLDISGNLHSDFYKQET